MARLVAASTEGFPSREAASWALSEKTALKWALGQSEQLPVDSCVLTVTSTVFERAYWMTVTRREAPDEKTRKEICLVARMSLGRTLTSVCHPSFTVLTKSSVPVHMHTTAHAHRGCGAHSCLSALSHTQISIWVQAVGLPHILSCREFSHAHWNASLTDNIVFRNRKLEWAKTFGTWARHQTKAVNTLAGQSQQYDEWKAAF